MRRRFIRSSLVIVLSGIGLLTVVMLWASGRGIVNDNLGRLAVNAERVAAEITERQHDGEALAVGDLEPLVPADRQALVVLDDGTRLAVGAPVGPSDYRATVDIPGHGQVTVVEQPDRINASRLVSAASILGLALLVSAVSVVVAFREARRLTAPLDDLAARAGGLGDAGPSAGHVRYGVAELDEVADALEAGAERIERLVEAERRLTTDASHQLRTPLTALSMRLEEILHTDSLTTVREEATEALVQVERLAGVVDDLLVHRSHAPATGVLLPVGDVVNQQLAEWQPAYSGAGRALERGGDTCVVPEQCGPVQSGPVGQVLSALLENALQHGGGRTTVGCRQLEGAVCVEVGDEGPGIPPDLVGHVFDRGVSGGAGTGLGLARARATAESMGGRLELVSASPARFAVFLTVGQDPPADASLATTLGNTQRR